MVPDYTEFSGPDLDEWKADVNSLLAEYNELFEAVKIKAALAVAMRIAALGNKLLQSNTLDNKTLNSYPERSAAVVGLALNLVHLLAAVVSPFMPAISASICSQVSLDTVLIPDVWLANTIKPGHRIGEARKLFEPIKPEKEQEWREQFGGEEARRQREEKAAKAARNKLNKAKKKQALSKQTESANVEAGVKDDVNGVDGLASEMSKSLQTS